MNWKLALDKYLTNEPDDGFCYWCEEVDNSISLSVWKENNDWFLEYDGKYNDWLNKLFNRGYEPKNASKIIERAFLIYQKK